MCPFAKPPEGMSLETLELLDSAFLSVWRDLQAEQLQAMKTWAASAENKQAKGAELITSIVAAATAGVADPERAKRQALQAAERSRARTRTIVHLPD